MKDSFFSGFFDFIRTEAKYIAPEFFSDDINLLALIYIVSGVTLWVLIVAWMKISERIKNITNRIIISVLMGLVLVDVLLIAIAQKIDLLGVLLFLLINLLFLIPVFLIKNSKDNVLILQDLKLTSQDRSEKGLLPCPVCGARTISLRNVISISQTCSECANKIQIKKSWRSEVLSSSPLLLIGALIYLAAKDKISTFVPILVGLPSIIIVIIQSYKVNLEKVDHGDETSSETTTL